METFSLSIYKIFLDDQFNIDKLEFRRFRNKLNTNIQLAMKNSLEKVSFVDTLVTRINKIQKWIFSTKIKTLNNT